MDLQARIGYSFQRPELLQQALTHSSFGNKFQLGSNERFEFLGDSIINFLIANEVFALGSKYAEGQLSVARASLVCNKMLAKLAREIGLEKEIRFIRIPNLQEPSDNMLADAFEALIAAIFLDGGLQDTQRVLLDLYDLEAGT